MDKLKALNLSQGGATNWVEYLKDIYLAIFHGYSIFPFLVNQENFMVRVGLNVYIEQ